MFVFKAMTAMKIAYSQDEINIRYVYGKLRLTADL